MHWHVKKSYLWGWAYRCSRGEETNRLRKLYNKEGEKDGKKSTIGSLLKFQFPVKPSPKDFQGK